MPSTASSAANRNKKEMRLQADSFALWWLRAASLFEMITVAPHNCCHEIGLACYLLQPSLDRTFGRCQFLAQNRVGST